MEELKQAVDALKVCLEIEQKRVTINVINKLYIQI